MSSHAGQRRHQLLATGLIMAGLGLVAAGYWGPWVWAEPAGLRVLGLDLAEYVKFIDEVRSGQMGLVREVFYLPLVALSVSLSLIAHRVELWLPRAGRWLLNLLAIPVALAMLPPAWTPTLLLTPEFIKQTFAIVACVIAAILSYPLWRRIPGRFIAVALGGLTLVATGPMLVSFTRINGSLDAIYGSPIKVGRGPLQMTLGFVLSSAGYVLALTHSGDDVSS